VSNSDGDAQQFEVITPSASQIKSYANSVCAALAEQLGDEAYISPDVVTGLTNFLQIIVHIHAKHYSKLVDKQLEEDYSENNQAGQQGAGNTLLP